MFKFSFSILSVLLLLKAIKAFNVLLIGLSSFVLAYATIEQLIIVMDYYYKICDSVLVYYSSTSIYRWYVMAWKYKLDCVEERLKKKKYYYKWLKKVGRYRKTRIYVKYNFTYAEKQEIVALKAKLQFWCVKQVCCRLLGSRPPLILQTRQPSSGIVSLNRQLAKSPSSIRRLWRKNRTPIALDKSLFQIMVRSKQSNITWCAYSADQKVSSTELNGRTCTLDVCSTNTINEVKLKYCHKNSLPIDSIRFIAQGKQLKTDKTLQHYCIERDATLHVVTSLRGGTLNASLVDPNNVWSLAELASLNYNDLLLVSFTFGITATSNTRRSEIELAIIHANGTVQDQGIESSSNESDDEPITRNDVKKRSINFSSNSKDGPIRKRPKVIQTSTDISNQTSIINKYGNNNDVSSASSDDDSDDDNDFFDDDKNDAENDEFDEFDNEDSRESFLEEYASEKDNAQFLLLLHEAENLYEAESRLKAEADDEAAEAFLGEIDTLNGKGKTKQVKYPFPSTPSSDVSAEDPRFLLLKEHISKCRSITQDGRINWKMSKMVKEILKYEEYDDLLARRFFDVFDPKFLDYILYRDSPEFIPGVTPEEHLDRLDTRSTETVIYLKTYDSASIEVGENTVCKNYLSIGEYIGIAAAEGHEPTRNGNGERTGYAGIRGRASGHKRLKDIQQRPSFNQRFGYGDYDSDLLPVDYANPLGLPRKATVKYWRVAKVQNSWMSDIDKIILESLAISMMDCWTGPMRKNILGLPRFSLESLNVGLNSVCGLEFYVAKGIQRELNIKKYVTSGLERGVKIASRSGYSISIPFSGKKVRNGRWTMLSINVVVDDLSKMFSTAIVQFDVRNLEVIITLDGIKLHQKDFNLTPLGAYELRDYIITTARNFGAGGKDNALLPKDLPAVDLDKLSKLEELHLSLPIPDGFYSSTKANLFNGTGMLRKFSPRRFGGYECGVTTDRAKKILTIIAAADSPLSRALAINQTARISFVHQIDWILDEETLDLSPFEIEQQLLARGAANLLANNSTYSIQVNLTTFTANAKFSSAKLLAPSPSSTTAAISELVADEFTISSPNTSVFDWKEIAYWSNSLEKNRLAGKIKGVTSKSLAIPLREVETNAAKGTTGADSIKRLKDLMSPSGSDHFTTKSYSQNKAREIRILDERIRFNTSLVPYAHITGRCQTFIEEYSPGKYEIIVQLAINSTGTLGRRFSINRGDKTKENSMNRLMNDIQVTLQNAEEKRLREKLVLEEKARRAEKQIDEGRKGNGSSAGNSEERSSTIDHGSGISNTSTSTSKSIRNNSLVASKSTNPLAGQPLPPFVYTISLPPLKSFKR